MNHLQYARFSGFYFFYFASLGIFLPFWPLYLQSLGFSALEIGQLLAVVMFAGIFAPNVWAWLADHTGHRLLLARGAALGSTLGILALQWVTDFTGMAALLLVFSFFWYATLPLVEGFTMSFLDHHPSSHYSYTHVRLWGSFGFVASCSSVAWLATMHGEDWTIVPFAMLLCHAGGFLLSLLLGTSTKLLEHPPHLTLMRLLRNPAMLGLLSAFVLMQVSHGPFYAFFSIYLQGHGYPLQGIASLWAVGVFGEILVFLFFSHYLAHHPARALFAVAFLLAGVRWLVVGAFPMYWGAILFAQTLHAASYGVYHAVAVRVVHQLFKGRLQSRGQALYSSLSYGAGAALGSLLAGVAWESMGSSTTFYAATAVALVGMVLGWVSLHYLRRLNEVT